MIKATFSCQVGRVSRRKHVRGFTLIELMIVVAVIGILSAIAYPSYKSYILKSRRADAKNALLDLAAREERVYSNTNQYTNDAATLGYSVLPFPVNSSGSSYYTLSVALDTSVTPTGYIAKATPTGSQTADTCLVFQVNQAGTQSNVDLAGIALTSANCW